jgi:hypothetical protein
MKQEGWSQGEKGFSIYELKFAKKEKKMMQFDTAPTP